MTPTRALLLVALAACASQPLAPPRTVAASPAYASLEAARDLDGAPIGHAATSGATLVISFASWCTYCHAELVELAMLRAQHPELRIVGVDYAPFETYAQRGGADQLRAFLAASAPWLRVVSADDALFDALGHPPKVPTLFVFDAHGQLAASYDRSVRAPPSAVELAALLARLSPVSTRP